jgi:hypothetical protein
VIPLLLQGSEWLIVLFVAIPIVVVGMIVFVIVKLGLAWASALIARNSNRRYGVGRH